MGQVVTYRNKPPDKMYCQIRLDSGERILITIGDSGIRVSKLGFGGRIRTGTVWKCSRDEIRDALLLFVNTKEPMTSTLDAIKDKLIDFQSVAYVKEFFNRKPVEAGHVDDN